MASVSPYLKLLLRPKQRPDIPYDDPNDLIDEPSQPLDERGGRIANTIPIRPRLSADPRVMSLPIGNGKYGERVIDNNKIVGLGTPQDYEPLAQQPTAPTIDGAVKPVIPLTPRDPWDERIAADQERIRVAQNKPHNRTKEVLEGLGTWAAGGLGIPLQRILHPGGTEEQKAQRQLATDVALRKESADAQDAQSTIRLRSTQARKIDADIQAAIDHPDTNDADKQKLITAKAILDSHPQPFDPSDPQDAIAIKKLNDAGIPIPQSYGKQPKEATPLFREVKQSDGSTLTKKSVDGGKTWETVDDLTSAAPEKPEEGDVPDTTQGWIQLETSHRTNAANAQTAAEKAEARVKTYIAQQKALDSSYDASKDPNVASLTAEARRQREYAAEQLKAADSAAAKKVEAANADAKAKSKTKKPARQGLSRGVFRRNNPEATKGKTDSQIDAMIRGGGLVPIP